MKKDIVFTGGGTAGHIMPNIALINQLKDKYNIHYIGSKEGMEKTLISGIKEVKYYPITTVKLIRSLSIKNLLIPFKLIKGIVESKKILRKIKPSLVFSKGGFVALPVCIASKCPLICHESDKTIGLSNRLIKKKAAYFCCCYEETVKKIGKNGVVTGLPIRQELYKSKELSKQKRVLVIMGGSLGAKSINECVFSCINELVKEFEVIHITGQGKSNDEIRINGYTQMEFCFDMPSLYQKADIVVSRGGATALFELIALKIPSLIIPLSKNQSRGDQIDNAIHFEKLNLIRVLTEGELNKESFIKSINDCINDYSLKKSLYNAQNIDGTKKIISLIENVLK